MNLAVVMNVVKTSHVIVGMMSKTTFFNHFVRGKHAMQELWQQ